jgi:hypothetical protein
MKNLIAFLVAIFAAKKTKFGCFGTGLVFIIVYWLVKKIL